MNKELYDYVFTFENIKLQASKNTIDYHGELFDIPNSIALSTCDENNKPCTWRLSNVTNKSFDIELLDIEGNLIPGKIVLGKVEGKYIK